MTREPIPEGFKEISDPEGLSPRERDFAIRTLYGEAAQEPEEGQLGVAAVIRNRVLRGNYGPDVESVVLARNQFEPWNRLDARSRMLALHPEDPRYQQLGDVVDRAWKGEDPTGGAVNFLNPEVVRARRNYRTPSGLPSWAEGEGQRIGRHVFYGGAGAGRDMPLERKPVGEPIPEGYKELSSPPEPETTPIPTVVGDSETPGMPTAPTPQGEPIPEGYTEISEPVGILGYPTEVVKDVTRGVIEGMVASPLRGLGARKEAGPAGQGRILERTMELIQEGMDPTEAEQQAVREGPGFRPVTEQPLYQAGEVVSEWQKQAIPSKDILNPVVRDLAQGAGSLLGNIGTAMIPGVGLPALAVTGVMAGSGEGAQRAVAAGATPEQQVEASALASSAGLTEFADALIPMLGSTGKALGFLGKVGTRVAYGAFTEGSQEGLQQFIQNMVAQGVYKPDQDLMEDVPYNAFLGAVLGGGATGLLGRGGREPPPAQAPEVSREEIASTPMVPPSPLTQSSVAAEPIPEGFEEIVVGWPPSGEVVETREGRIADEVESRRGPFVYSRLKEFVEKGPSATGAMDWLRRMQNSGTVKAEELTDLGVEKFLADSPLGGKVSKADLLAHIESEELELITNVDPKLPGSKLRYEEYLMPGPFRQAWNVLLRTPTPAGAEMAYYGPHFDEPNIVAHAQATRRLDVTGAEGLLLDAVQSDLHERGRKSGYWTREDKEARQRTIQEKLDNILEQAQKARDRGDIDTLRALMEQQATVLNARTELESLSMPSPAFPFKTSWHELMIKRMMRFAADRGFRRIYLPRGEDVAEYNTGGQIDEKEAKGLIYFYNTILTSAAKKWAKRIGATVGETSIPSRTQYRSFETLDADGQVVLTTFDDVEAALKAQEIGGTYREITDELNRRVMFIDLPPWAASNIQSGFPRYAQSPVEAASVSGAVGPIPANATKEVAAAVRKMGGVLKEVIKRFEIAAPIRLSTINNPNETARAYVDKYSDGSYHIVVNLTFNPTVAQAYDSFMHEMGHVILYEKFDVIPEHVKRELQASYRKHVEETTADTTTARQVQRQSSAITNYTAFSGMFGKLRIAPLGRLTTESQKYWNLSESDKGFHEWFAENVARWATSTEQGLSLGERYMKGIGKTLLEALRYMSEMFGMRFTPDRALRGWLDSHFDAPSYTEVMLAEVDARTTEKNRLALQADGPLDQDVPGVPYQWENEAAMGAISAAFRGGELPPGATAMRAHADKMTWRWKWGLGLDRLVDRNPRFVPLLRYAEKVREMAGTIATVSDAALRVIKGNLRPLGAELDNVFQAVDYITNMRYLSEDEVARGVERHPTPDELTTITEKFKLSPRGVEAIAKMKKTFEAFIEAVARAKMANIAATATDPRKAAERIDELRAQMEKMLKKPYFPFTHFGRYYVSVHDAAGALVHVAFTERSKTKTAKQNQMTLQRDLEAKYPKDKGFLVESDMLPETVSPFMGLPATMLQWIDEDMTLTDAQKKALKFLKFSPAPKRYIPGYSDDLLRSYSLFFFHGSRYLGQLMFGRELRGLVNEARNQPGNVAKEIGDYMGDHLQNTVLDARSDYSWIKGAAFSWMFGFYAAGAALNLTQTPLITYPWLAEKFGGIGVGDARAAKALARAGTQLKNFWTKGRYANDVTNEFAIKAFNYGIRSGRLTETQSPEIAGFSQGQNLLNLGRNAATRAGQAILEKASWMFEMAEQFNRRLVYAAAMQLATENPNAVAVQEAVNKYADEMGRLQREENFTEAEARTVVTGLHAIDQTQYVYARYARARFMRHPVTGTMFVFKNYLLNTMWLWGANKGTFLRSMMVLAAMGGLMGMPGTEDAEDLLKPFLKWLFGRDFDLKKEVRTFIRNHMNGTVDPEIVLHGLARKGMGVPALLDMIGIKVPSVDFSGPISMGRLLPIQPGKLIDPEKPQDPGEQVIRAGGAAASVAFNIYQAIFNSRLSPTDFKRYERAVPRALGSLSQSYRAFTEGRERFRGLPDSAPTVVPFDRRDPQHMAEMIGMALGFRPFRLAQQYDAVRMQAEQERRVEVEKRMLYEQMFEATLGKNPKEIEKVTRAIIDYNKALPSWQKDKAITQASLQASMRSRARAKEHLEAGIPQRRSSREAAAYIQSLFPGLQVDVRRAPSGQ